MARDVMSYWLAVAAGELREAKSRKMVHVASQLSKSESSLSRFERHLVNPRNLDATVAAYARDLEMRPIDIWARALDLWRADEGGGVKQGAAGAPPEPGGEVGRRIEDVPPSAEDPRPQANPAAEDDQRGSA